MPSGFSIASSQDLSSARAEKVLVTRELARYLDELTKVHLQRFDEFENPALWDAETKALFARFVEKELKKGVPFWRRSRRAAIKASLPSEVEHRMQGMIEASEALERNVPDAVLARLEVAFDDNHTPAFPMRCAGDSVTVAIVVRDVDSLLGNRVPGITKAGNPSLRVWPKRDRNSHYIDAVMSDVIATALETFACAPAIYSVDIVVIARTEADFESPTRIDAIMHVHVPREKLEGLDWSNMQPADVVNELPKVFIQNSKTLAFEPLRFSDHPDIEPAVHLVREASRA